MSTTCMSPFSKQIDNQWMDFPCGKCEPCLKRRVSGWSFRLTKEGQRSHAAHFVTLTYNTDYVPITKNGFMSLNKRDLQLFYKRLRKLSPKLPKIKYYSVGEYGGKTFRPHYHVILFNADISNVEKAWKLGEIHVGQVSEASVGYTLKYVCKPGKIPLHQNDDRIPEFATMSKRLGDNYITPSIIAWHKADLKNRYYTPLKDGKKIALPRYYKDKIYCQEEREYIGQMLQLKPDKNHVELTEKNKVDLFKQKQKHKYARLTTKL